MKSEREGRDMKAHNREPQMTHVAAIVERARAHISKPDVAGFTIGYSSGPPANRVRGSDHRDHARTEEPITLAEGLTRRQALDLEAQVTTQINLHDKYDKKDIRYTRSAGGGPRVLPDCPVHVVYLAWASVSGRTRHDLGNRALLDAIATCGNPEAKVYQWIDDDQGYLLALSVPGHFVMAIGKQNVHFHVAQCRFAELARPSENPNPLTGNGRKKYTGESLAALYLSAEQNCPRKLAGQKNQWQVCHCLSDGSAHR